MAHSQQIFGCTFDGNIVIEKEGAKLLSSFVNGTVRVSGVATNVRVQNVDCHGLIVRPRLKDRIVQVGGSEYSNITNTQQTSQRQNYPVALAHLDGTVKLHCAQGTSYVLQPARRTNLNLETDNRCNSVQPLDLGALYGIFGGAVESIILGETLNSDTEAFNAFLNSYIAVVTVVVVVQLFIVA
jgi:hypothetical protein